MPRPSGAPTAADHATATTSASANSTIDAASLRDPQQTPQGLAIATTGSAIVTATAPTTKHVETYVETPYKNNIIAKNPHKKVE